MLYFLLCCNKISCLIFVANWLKVSCVSFHHLSTPRVCFQRNYTLHLFRSIRSARSETNNHLRSKVFHGNSNWAITHASQPSELRWCGEKVVGVKGGPVTSRPMNSDPPTSPGIVHPSLLLSIVFLPTCRPMLQILYPPQLMHPSSML